MTIGRAEARVRKKKGGRLTAPPLGWTGAAMRSCP